MTRPNAAEWNAGIYHEVSNPHVGWGANLIDSLDLQGSEIVADAGCGTGRVTADLLERLPQGPGIAVDRSANMVDEARAYLTPRFGHRIEVLQVDLLAIEPDDIGKPVDLVFSTATFHWIRDHDTLFSRLFALLKPGGRLVAQCGGGPNLQRHVDRAVALMKSDPWQPYFHDWDPPSFSVDETSTADRLRTTGFIDIETSLVAAPTTLEDAETFSTFMTNVVFREHLMQLPDEDFRDAFIADLTRQAAGDVPPFSLDYWRLNMRGTRPPGM